MVDVPPATPVTAPGPNIGTVATPVVPLLQVPPGVVLLRVVIDPWHTTAVPVRALGIGFTDCVLVI
jgi:hypothetical protein